MVKQEPLDAADMIADAIAHRSEFNVIELQTMFKIDVFVPLLDIVTRRELNRGQTIVLDEAENVSLRFITPEDTIAHKLRWFKLGGGNSERQWLDALGVLVVKKGAHSDHQRVATTRPSQSSCRCTWT